MGLSNVNWDTVSANSGLIEVGEHTLKIVKAKETTSNKGNEMLVVEFEKGVRHNFMTGNEIGLSILKSACEKSNIPMPSDPNDLIERYMRVDIFHEEYNGRDYAKIKSFKKIVDKTILAYNNQERTEDKAKEESDF